MNIKNLKELILKKTDELYSFSFALIPDDLQASQILIDSIAGFVCKFIENKPNLNEIELNVKLYKNVFELSKIRYSQLKMTFKDIENTEKFFFLDLNSKATIFLNEKTKFSKNEILQILQFSKEEYYSILYLAREKLFSTNELQEY